MGIWKLIVFFPSCLMKKTRWLIIISSKQNKDEPKSKQSSKSRYFSIFRYYMTSKPWPCALACASFLTFHKETNEMEEDLRQHCRLSIFSFLVDFDNFWDEQACPEDLIERKLKSCLDGEMQTQNHKTFVFPHISCVHEIQGFCKEKVLRVQRFKHKKMSVLWTKF